MTTSLLELAKDINSLFVSIYSSNTTSTLSVPYCRTNLKTKNSFKAFVIMSKEYEGQDPLAIAQQAERDLNSNAAKTGDGNKGASDSTKVWTRYQYCNFCRKRSVDLK